MNQCWFIVQHQILSTRRAYQWLSERLQYLPCVSNGDIVDLPKTIKMALTFIFMLVEGSLIQLTPIISCQLEAKICEHKLSVPNLWLLRSQSNSVTSAPLKPKQYVERWLHLHFADIYTHRHHSSDKSQQVISDFNNYMMTSSNGNIFRITGP